MAFNTGELEGLRSAAEASMLDSCVIGASVDSAVPGEPGGKTWSFAADPVSFGIQEGKPQEVLEAGQVTITDAVARFPIGTVLEAGSQIKVTKRQGVELSTPVYYALLGAPSQGVSCLVASLRRIRSGRSLL